jgi:translation initiation factor 2D
MDQYFKEAFFNVLKLTKIEGELPIDSGRFFSDYMVLARPEGVKLEIKDSTYKKLGKFYEEMAKAKFIDFKPAK